MGIGEMEALPGRPLLFCGNLPCCSFVFKTSKPSSRLIRWALSLQKITFTVEYRKGKFNTVKDALSRAPHDQPSPASLKCIFCRNAYLGWLQTLLVERNFLLAMDNQVSHCKSSRQTKPLQGCFLAVVGIGRWRNGGTTWKSTFFLW